MKRILFICLLFIATINSYAQTRSKECFYHVKFYKWEWDYCKIIGYDTIPKYSMITGERVGDTILWDTSYRAISRTDLSLSLPFPPSFVNSPQQIIVTSFDGSKTDTVKSFKISCVGNGVWATHKVGSTCTEEELKKMEAFIKQRETVTTIYITINLEGTDDEIGTADAQITLVRTKEVK